MDESPTKENKIKAWLWVAVAPLFAVFGIFHNRARESFVKLIGNDQGIILNGARAKMYWDGLRLQWCWAHLKRDIQAWIDSSDRPIKRLGHDLMREQRRLFELWHRYKQEEISWEELWHTKFNGEPLLNTNPNGFGNLSLAKKNASTYLVAAMEALFAN